MLGRDPLQDIVALDSGRLSDRRRDRALARVAADPELRRQVDQQRRVRAALSGLSVEAPATLRSSVARLRATPRPDRRRALLPAVAATAVLAIAATLTLALSNQAPTTTAVGLIVHQAATDPAPARADSPALLDREFAGVRFPNWAERFGWHTSGARRDSVRGRATDTVFFFHEGHRIAYTVVDGPPLDPPGDARRIRAGTTPAFIYHDDEDHTVITFERNGRTCVLSGHVIHDATLVRLAGWRGDGALRF